MTATLPGGRDVADLIAGPPPADKRSDTPPNWEDRAEDWWAHVTICPACAEHYQAPERPA